MKRDIVYIIVIAVLLTLTLSYSGLIPQYIPIPQISKPSEVVKTVFIPKTITTTKIISMKPTTVTQVRLIRVNVTNTVTQTQLRVETVYRTIVLTETKMLSTTHLITKTIEKTITVTEYPKEVLKRNITIFLMPSDEVLLGLSNISTKIIKRYTYLFLSFSVYDLNKGKVSCEGADCFINEASLDHLGSSLRAEFKSDNIKISIAPKTPIDVRDGLIYIHLFIPETENYATRINNRTLEAVIEDPTIKSPILKINMYYSIDAAYEVKAKPIKLLRAGYGWYMVAFKVEGLNVTKLTLSIRRYVLFIKYVVMDKVLIIPRNNLNITMHLSPPIMTLLDIVKSMNKSCNNTTCTYIIPSEWIVSVSDCEGTKLYTGDIKVEYTLTLTREGKILAVTPTADIVTLHINVNLTKYVRTLPGFVHIILYFNPKFK